MFSENDSDATYCSEVEQLLIAATNVAPKKPFEEIPLRRSQRLLHKVKKRELKVTGNNMHIKKIEKTEQDMKTCVVSINSQDIFSCLDLSATSLGQQYISSNEIVSCASQVRKRSPTANSVPLDLTKKSKVSTQEAPQREKIYETTITEVSKSNIEKARNVAKINKENSQLSTYRKDYINGKNSKRQIKSNMNKSTTFSKSSGNKFFEEGQIKTRNCSKKSVKNPNGSISNSKERENVTKISNNNLLQTNKCPPSQKKSVENFTSAISGPRKKCNKNKNGEKKPTNLLGKIDNIRCSTKNSYKQTDRRLLKRTCECGYKNHKNVTGCNCLPKIWQKNLSQMNKYINGNKLNNPTQSGIISPEEHSKISEKKVKTYELCDSKREIKPKIAETQQIFATIFKKRMPKLCENASKTSSNESQQDIKLEPLRSLDNEAKTVPNKFQNNTLPVNSEFCTYECTMNKKSSNKLKSRMPRKAIPSFKKQILNKNTANKTIDLKKECTNFKIEMFSQQSSQGKIQNKRSQKNKGSDLKLSSFSGEVQKGVNSFRKTKQPKASSHPIADSDSIKSRTKKNYIKSFDRSQFLQEIQNSQYYIDAMNIKNYNYSQIHPFQIPPTPGESQDLLKKPILPDVYPPHFKNQLPPEAVLTQSLDPAAYPANATTPADNISSELNDSSSSSPSLPESLCELFQSKNIKSILSVERTSYRLYSYHIQALALILNLRLEYLIKTLEKIMNISPHVLKSIDKAVKMPFVPDNDLFPTSSAEIWEGSDVVLNSQSPKQRKMCKTNNKLAF